MEGLASGSSSSELDIVAAAKAHSRAAATAGRHARTPPRPLPLPPTAAAASSPKPAAPSDSDEEPFDLIAAAKKQQHRRSPSPDAAPRPPPSPRHARASSAAPPPRAKAHAAPEPSRSTPQLRESESDSEGLDMVALARSQRARPPMHAAAAAMPPPPQPRPAAPAADPGASSSPAAATHQRQQRHNASLAPAEQAVPAPAPTQPLALPGAPAVSPVRTATTVVHEAVGDAPSLQALADSQLPVLPDAVEAGSLPASPSSRYGRQGRSPSRLGSAPAPAAGQTPQGAAVAQGAVAVPLASLEDLGDVLGSVVSDLKSSLREDLSRMEAGWQARWQAASDGTADLRGRLDRLAASSTSQAQEVSSALQRLQGELAAQRGRLEAVERAQQGAGASPAPASAPTSAAAPAASPCHWQLHEPAGYAESPAQHPTSQAQLPPQPTSAQAPLQAGPAPAATGPESGSAAPTVAAILRRLSALEDRVGHQIHSLEVACAAAGGPSSAPVSPLRSGGWPEQEGAHRSPSRAQRVAAVAAAAIYGSDSLASEVGAPLGGSPLKHARTSWAAYDAMPGSPRIGAAGVVRPASAGAGAYCSTGAGVRRPPTSAERGRSRAEVEAQVAQTHAIIESLQSQIAALSHSTAELAARRAEAASPATARRLDQLERSDRCAAVSAQVLERRVRDLETSVAGLGRGAAEGRAAAADTRAALSALEWRLDKSSDATVGAVKALEARQDKLRSDVAATACTATLAEAKASGLAAEVARLQRRVHGAGSPLGSPGKATFRLY